MAGQKHVDERDAQRIRLLEVDDKSGKSKIPRAKFPTETQFHQFSKIMVLFSFRSVDKNWFEIRRREKLSENLSIDKESHSSDESEFCNCRYIWFSCILYVCDSPICLRILLFFEDFMLPNNYTHILYSFECLCFLQYCGLQPLRHNVR